MNTETQTMPMTKKNFLAIGSFTLSVYFVMAVWGFWSHFVDALGFNATIFILGLVLLFLGYNGITNLKNHYSWGIPILLVSLSFSLWENPFLKVISILILPFTLSVVFNYALNPNRKLDLKFIFLSVMDRVLLLTKLQEATKLVFGKLNSLGGNQKKLAYRIVLGLSLFFILALIVFIPLLSSIDSEFARLMKGVSEWFYQLVSFRYIGRMAFAVVATIFLIGYFLSFRKEPVNTEDQASLPTQRLDPVVSGIVLAGVMSLYLIFIAIQFAHLWVNKLPFDFHQTEQLVKSGFWQLFILSVINIIFFFVYFKKTNGAVQNLLKAFIIASFLLLMSAGQRMYLYVFFYGLSYEKFFASYTVIYCGLLFIWLAYQLFANKDSNILKYLVFSLLWMYCLATVMPVERMIFSFNARMAGRPDSRIKMNELKMLSSDVLPLVTTFRDDSKWQKEWCDWAHNKIKTVEKKKWYEKNLSNFSNPNAPESWEKGDCE